MKFYESGISGNKTIMLLPGNFMTHRQFEFIAPKLAEEYHVICVDFDGYDETGETTYTTAEDQAQKLANYIKANLDGRIDLVYAESLGSVPAAALTRIADIEIGGIILSGAQYLSWGFLNPICVKLFSKMAYSMMKNFLKDGEINLPDFLVKSMGRNAEGMKVLVKQLCQNPTLATTEATFQVGVDCYPQMIRTWEPNENAKVACWYGEKEENMKKAVKELKRAFPKLEVRVFKGMGHGENVEHVDLVVSTLKAFMGW